MTNFTNDYFGYNYTDCSLFPDVKIALNSILKDFEVALVDKVTRNF